MQEMLAGGEAINLSSYQRTPEGGYLLPDDLSIDGMDLCDAAAEAWIWLVYQPENGQRIAITGPEQPAPPGCQVVWAR
jgi:hypothetical protein